MYDPFDAFDGPDFDEDYEPEDDLNDDLGQDFASLVTHFCWRTSEGEVLTPAQMQTSHLFNCVRMIYNHTAPEEMRLRPYKEWPGWYAAPAFDKKVAVMAFLLELASRRSHLTLKQLQELGYMAACTHEVWEESRSMPQLSLP